MPADTRAADTPGSAPARSARKRRPPRYLATDAIAADDLFRDGKDTGALRTIGEVAKALGLRQHVLRYWEEQFAMLRPLTRAGGRRYYRPEDIALLIVIDRLLHREGYTIRGARQALARSPLQALAAARNEAVPATLPEPDFGSATGSALVVAVGVLRQHLEAIRDRLASGLTQA